LISATDKGKPDASIEDEPGESGENLVGDSEREVLPVQMEELGIGGVAK